MIGCLDKRDLVIQLRKLEKKYGSIRTIVLATSSGLEHKIPVPAMCRTFSNAKLWVSPGQWSFPFSLPLSWLGFPKDRTRVLLADGLPHKDTCDWISLGPLDIGLGRFQEIACYHKKSQTLIVTDALIGIQAQPPMIFDVDPTPLLFHAREAGDEPLKDSSENRKKGWARLVLFASYLKPDQLDIPPISEVFKKSFKPGLRNLRAHFGIYPFAWKSGWKISAKSIIGDRKPLLQVAPVLERLVFPRAKVEFLRWLDELSKLKGMKRLVSSHYSAPVEFTPQDCANLRKKINFKDWAPSDGDWTFLGSLDQNLLKSGVIPKSPLNSFQD